MCSKLEGELKKVAVRYFYIVILIFFIFSVYYWYEDIVPIKYLVLSFVLVHCFLMFVPLTLKYEHFKPLIPIYLVFISLILYVLVFMFWQIGHITAFMWYLLIPSGAMVFFPSRIVVFWCIYVLIQICSIFLISAIIPFHYEILLTSSQLTTVNIMTSIFSICFFFYFIISWLRVNQIKIHEMKEQEAHYVVTEDDKIEHNTDKYNELYNKIVELFEKEKPYCDPEFTITHLATALYSNVNYVAKAIKLNKGTNFSVFINTYRISMIKDMFDKNFHNTYTIKYIYTSAGFKYQSTFNKVFKQIEGITPTDYIKDHNVNVDIN